MTELPTGLRERKKIKTRLAIRQHAMALFEEQGYERTAVPELRGRMLAQVAGMIQMIAAAVAERVGRPDDDFEVRNFAGALIGVALGVMLSYGEEPGSDYLKLFDRAIAHLEAGLPI